MVGEDEESDYKECAFAFFSPVEMPGEPATLKEALETSDAEEWKKSMESELKSIEENGTWELVELPEGRKAITSKWLFKIKSDADGKIERYKSRLVAKGYQQKEKVDYKELFAPVVKLTTLRTLLAGAAIKGWVVKQMDVTTAFLNGVLEEEIFMAQPEGFDDGSGRVLRLKKALYGLKQAPRQWYLELRGVLGEIGFTPSTADHSLFMLGEGEQRSFMVVYVDDILIFSPSSDLVKEVMLKVQDNRSELRLPLAGDAAPAGARGARALVGLAGALDVVVLAVEGDGVVVGEVAGVEVAVAAVEAEEAVAVAEGAEAAEVAEAAEAAVELVAALRRGVPPVAASASSSSAVVRPRPPSSFVSGTLGCGGLHSTQRCFGRLTDAWRHQFPDATEIPRWGDLFRAGVAIFDLDYDAILAAMYAVSTSDEGDCYLCLPPDPGGEAAALGACEAAALGASASAAPGVGESALSGTTSAQVFHTFTLDSGAFRSFFRDRTTLTPLSRPVAVSLADPSGGPVLASFSTVLPCPAAPSGTLSGLYLPSFSTNLVSGADLQDQGVDQLTPASQRVTHCTCARTGRHLATFTRRPGSSLYTLSTESPPVPASGQVAASSQVFAAASGSGPKSAPCSCRLLSHQTLLWHHRLGHPSLPRLRGMASRVLVSGLPRSLPPLPPGPAPTCVPCVEGQQRTAPHSSEFPLTEAPLQTLHMDVWGPARVRGQGHERYFLLVVDDYSRYTMMFPLRSKGDVTEVLIDWIREARLQLRESFGSDLPVLRLHSDRGGQFSSARLGAFCRAQGIRQTFTLPASPQQNGIAERRIGMVMDVARTSMIHAAAPHFLWPFAVGDASAFRVWGSRAFVRDLCADKLSPHAVPCVFLSFPPDAPGWHFYHPTSRHVLSSQDVTFDKSVPYYRLFPYRTAPLPPPPLFLAPGPPPVDPLPPQGPAPSGVSQVDAVEPVEVAVDSGAARGAEPVGAGSRGAESGGAEPGGAESGGAEPGGAEPGGAESGGAEPGDAEPGGAESARVASRSASSRRELLSPQELREWFARRWSRAAGAGGPPVATGLGGARTCGTKAVGTGGSAAATGVGPAGASGAAGAGATGGVGARVGAAGASGAAGGQCGPKAWKILKDVHAPSSEAMVVVLERQLHAVKINEGDAVQGAFDQLRDLYVKLSAAGVDYPEKIKCYKALSLLPELWGPLVVNLNGMKDSWSLEWIRAQVLQEEFRRKELTAAAGEGRGSAYGMKGFKGHGSKKGKAKEGSGGEQYSGGKRSNKGGKRCGGKCWYCHVEGHPCFECRKLPDGWRPGQPSIEGSKGVHRAMGEGMGSEEGDGGAGGHGGMFYHVGEASSEDMVVPASKVALHRSSHWVIDTGAFMTMTNREDLLDEVRPSKAATVVSATSQVVPVRGEGRAMFMGADGRLVGLKRVLLVPGLCANLLSTKALSEAGMKMEMMGTKVFKATLDGRVLWDLRGGKDMHRSMWEIPVLPWKEAAARLAAEAVRGGYASHVTSGGGGDGSDGGLLVHGGDALPSVTTSTDETDWLTAHRRFGHVALPQLQQLFKEERVKGLRIKGEPKDVGSCETCLTSKFSRFPFHSTVGQSSDPVELVHVDLVGPMKVKGDGGALYSMTLVDDYTRLTWSFPLAKKSDAARVIIEEWLPMVERESGKRVKAIRSDRGGEFLGAEFRSWLKRHGIKQQLTTAFLYGVVDEEIYMKQPEGYDDGSGHYAAGLVAESASICPPSVGGECALSMDTLEDRQEEFQYFDASLPHLVSTLIAPEGDPDAPDIPTPRSYAEAIEGPYSSQLQSAMDAEMASWKSTGTYVDEVPQPGANIVSGMWIFRVKRPPGSPPVFSQR
ncbi:unnamed protein product [Closterium sp. NIES-54]